MRDRKRADVPRAIPWAPIAVAVAIVVVALLRLRVADIPLERDEGEYAYAGRLILDGVPPYSVAYNMKFPGTYYAYAVILALFGKTAWAIHFGLLLVNAATIWLVFAVGRRLSGSLAGAAGATSYAFLSIDRWVLGPFAHATHFVVFAVMAGLIVLLRALDRRRQALFFWSGVLFGLAVLFKQHAVFFLPLAAFLAFQAGAKRLGVFALGSALPVGVMLCVLFAQGVLGRFWFWTFRYASAYVSEVPVREALSNLGHGFAYASTGSLASWILAGLGLCALWLTHWDRRARIVLTGFLIAAFVSILPGFYFRAHYFILMLPVVAMLIGVAVASLKKLLWRVMPPAGANAVALAVLVLSIGMFLAAERGALFSMTPRALSRDIYGSSPFIEAEEIAKYLRERTSPADIIAVVGSEPEIYFYADRPAATGYIYTYALMEPQPFAPRMQEEMIQEIETAHPSYLVFPWIKDSWLAQPGSDQRIVTWARRYVRQCYDPVGVADIASEETTHMKWDEAVRGYVAQSENLVYTFKRKSDAACVVEKGDTLR